MKDLFLKGRTFLRSDYFLTFITEAVVLIGTLLSYKYSIYLLGEESFAEYSLCRRTISFIQPVQILGLGIGLVKFISSSKNSTEKSDYYLAGIAGAVAFNLAIVLLINLFSNKFSFLFFGSVNYSRYAFPLSIMIFGLLMHVLVYSYLRATFQYMKANLLQLINLGVYPFLVFFLTNSVQNVFLLNGSFWIITSLFFFLFILKDLRIPDLQEFKRSGKELFNYSLKRVPGDVVFAAMFSLPVLFVTHVKDVRMAGFVAFGISILNMTGGIFTPISIILLPKTSLLLAEKKYKELKNAVQKLLVISTCMAIFGFLVFEICADWLIQIYLKDTIQELILICRILMTASVFYVIFICLRSVIDAGYKGARNGRNIFLCLVFFLLLSVLSVLLKQHYILIIVYFVLTINLLGGLTLLDYRKIIGGKV